MKQRVLTALVLIPIVLGLLFWPHPAGILVLVAVFLASGTVELQKIGGTRIWESALALAFTGLIALLSIPTTAYVGLPILIGLSIVGVLCGIGICYGKDSGEYGVAFWFYAGLFGSVTLTLGQKLYPIQFGGTSAPVILVSLIPLWIGDSLAYFVGKRFGKHPLAPKISPKKTWEGAVANFIGCLIGAVALAPWIHLSALQLLSIGAVAGILGQLGDLFQSALKRKADLKDSGNLLPGHGGILDRIDSLLMSGPFTQLLLIIYINGAQPPISR